MAETEYHRGEMDISEHERTWSAFMVGSAWTGFITLLAIGFLTLVFAMGMNWLIALGLMAAAGIGIGVVAGMGSAWYAAIGIIVVLTVVLRLLIAIFGAITGVL